VGAGKGPCGALLAAGGYTGIKRVYEREYGGFLSVFGEGHAPDARRITDGLGERWETQRIAIKPYAAMGALHAPLGAIFHLMKQRPLRDEEIDRVDIYMSHAAYHHGWWRLERLLTPIAAQMTVAYAIAVAILDGAAMVQQFAPQRIDRDDVWQAHSQDPGAPRARVRQGRGGASCAPGGPAERRLDPAARSRSSAHGGLAAQQSGDRGQVPHLDRRHCRWRTPKRDRPVHPGTREGRKHRRGERATRAGGRRALPVSDLWQPWFSTASPGM